MSKYGQYCPIAQALELLGDRWTLLIIRDMLTGTRHFNDLHRGLPKISRALLSKRLRQLEHDGIVVKHKTDSKPHTTEYQLTNAGMDLHSVIHSLLVWGTKWSFGDPELEHLDPLLLMWWMRGRVNHDNTPAYRITIQFDFYQPRTDHYWLSIGSDDVVICVNEPGFEINVIVKANLREFYKVWLGRISYGEAVRSGAVIVDAIPKLQRGFPTWFEWSPAAEVVSRIHS